MLFLLGTISQDFTVHENNRRKEIAYFEARDGK
jgi:hypothetical protein